MMTWAIIAMVAGLAWVVYGPVLRRSRSARTLHFRNGVCEENEIGVWKYLRYLGLRRELGKELWPEGHDRVLTAEYGAYRPPRVDVYYWMDFPIWEQNRRPYGDSRRARGLLVQIRGHRDCSGRRGANSVLNPSRSCSELHLGGRWPDRLLARA